MGKDGFGVGKERRKMGRRGEKIAEGEEELGKRESEETGA